jgi:hypothetical protein
MLKLGKKFAKKALIKIAKDNVGDLLTEVTGVEDVGEIACELTGAIAEFAEDVGEIASDIAGAIADGFSDEDWEDDDHPDVVCV